MQVCILIGQFFLLMSNKISFTKSSLNSNSSEKFSPMMLFPCCRMLLNDRGLESIALCRSIFSLLVPYKYLRMTLMQPQLCPHPLAPCLWGTGEGAVGPGGSWLGSWERYPCRLLCLYLPWATDCGVLILSSPLPCRVFNHWHRFIPVYLLQIRLSNKALASLE